MIAALALYAAVGAALVAFGARLGRRAFAIGALPPAVSTAWALARLGGVVDGRAVTEHLTWVGGLDLAIDLRFDALAATMTLVVAVIGVLVMAYSAWYFPATDVDVGRLAGLLVLFAGGMVGVVQADHLLALYGFWEVTTVTSYLLIGHEFTDGRARAAALHALVVTGAGGLAMLGGFVLLGHAAGTYRLSALVSSPPPVGTTVTVAVVLILVGAFTKSAQYPFHAWLPGAMAAPTPVSAYLHSATMVKAGVYLVARLAPLFAAGNWVWRPAVLTVGLTTLVLGGLRALRQRDLKLLLAFGTVSQLGLMIVLFGAGTPATTAAGWTLLVAHALFKAALFMVVGVVDHETGTRSLGRLPVMRGGAWDAVRAVSFVSAASMAGIPLLIGFVAKEGAYAALHDASFTAASLVLAVAVAGSMLTVAYSARFHLGAFVWHRRTGDEIAGAGVPAAPFVAPAAVLALATVVFGLVPGVLDRVASASSSTHIHLAVWHGWNTPLLLSAVTLAGGALVVAFDHRVQRVLAAGRTLPTGEDAYVALLERLAAVSRRVTGVVQSGSLPVYAGVVLTTAAVLPGFVLATRADWPGWGAVFDTAANVPIAGLLIVAAFGAAIVRRRFSAAVILGAAGYAMAALFVVHGAPDLALTQAAIETLSTVLFVLVLRRLPEGFERQSSPRRRALRVGIAALVGSMVFVFALVAAGSRTAPPVSGEMVARSVPDGGGRNVVNVILVDFRGLDTMGEITVLAAASIGAVALARAGRRPGAPLPVDGVDDSVTRIVFVDVSAQVVFYAVLMGSLWLLFAGHNQPGGGFVGGLLAGAAIALRYIAGGMREVRTMSRFRPWTVLGAGLLVAAATATLPLLSGDPVLSVASTTWTLPLAGAVKVSSALVFDIGVYLTVVGMVLMVFEAFGDEPRPAAAVTPR
ncbi:MAG TPA: hydrogen gas-evolving membrane-bound hydrogenase subunit E [Acidimicrobiales bacterium]|nr:hydrogen gas-evolving membrane-bound hydrogenase subunit E [Acidimicrobiales bacterium]